MGGKEGRGGLNGVAWLRLSVCRFEVLGSFVREPFFVGLHFFTFLGVGGVREAWRVRLTYLGPILFWVAPFSLVVRI